MIHSAISRHGVRFLHLLFIAGWLAMLAGNNEAHGADLPTVEDVDLSIEEMREEIHRLRVVNQRLVEELRRAEDRHKGRIEALNEAQARILKLELQRRPTTQPITPDAPRAVATVARLRSSGNLRIIGGALIMYANKHDQKAPATLEELRLAPAMPPEALESPFLNSRYQYLRSERKRTDPDEVVAYEDNDDAYTSILFADNFVETFPNDQAATIIANGRK